MKGRVFQKPYHKRLDNQICRSKKERTYWKNAYATKGPCFSFFIGKRQLLFFHVFSIDYYREVVHVSNHHDSRRTGDKLYNGPHT